MRPLATAVRALRTIALAGEWHIPAQRSHRASCTNSRKPRDVRVAARCLLKATGMKLISSILVAPITVLVACGSASDSWPETLETTAKWPRFGQQGVVSPAWIAPRQFGCAQRVKVRREPQRDFEPGESAGVVYGDVVDSQCATLGARIRVVDEDPFGAALIQGNCREGYGMTVRGTRLAVVVFGDASACEAYGKVRSSAAPARTTTVLRLVALQPVATFAFVSADANGTELGVEDVP